MSCFYLLGGRQKKLRLKKEEEWNLYEAALIVELNTETGEPRQRVEYHTPPEARASDNASHLFKAGTTVSLVPHAGGTPIAAESTTYRAIIRTSCAPPKWNGKRPAFPDAR